MRCPINCSTLGDSSTLALAFLTAKSFRKRNSVATQFDALKAAFICYLLSAICYSPRAKARR